MPTILPLEPAVVASQVIAEVREFTGAPLAQEKPLVARLSERAQATAQANPRFRRQLQGSRGRDHLYAFMRHWLAAELKRTHPAVFRRLPAGFAVGEESCQGLA